MITLIPDFTAWASKILEEIVFKGNSLKTLELADELKRAFGQGRDLGQKEMLESNQLWWEEQDKDLEWIYAHGEGKPPETTGDK